MFDFIWRSSRPEVLYEKGVLRNFAKNHRKTPVPKAYNFIKKETLVQVFSCEFCKISKNTFSYRTPQVAASVFGQEYWRDLTMYWFLPSLHTGSTINNFYVASKLIKTR